LRLVHILAMRQSPWFDHPIIDALTYNQAAVSIATGRRLSLRSRRTSKNGRAIRRMRQIVGIPTVARITDSGHLKIRSR